MKLFQNSSQLVKNFLFTFFTLILVSLFSVSANASCSTNANGTIFAGSNGDSCTNTGNLSPATNYAGMADDGKNYVSLTNTSSGVITLSGLSGGGNGNPASRQTPVAFLIDGNNSTAVNSGSIISNATSGGAYAANYSFGNSLINNGSIVSNGENSAALTYTIIPGATNQFTNAKGATLISSGIDSFAISAGGQGGLVINNAGSIISSGLGSTTLSLSGASSSGILVSTVNNSGVISSSGGIDGYGNSANPFENGIFTNTTLINSGIISSTSPSSDAILNDPGAIFQLITNTGAITSSYGYGINNRGTIVALNNAQGGNTPLTYTGNLPQSYGIILGPNATTYGKLAATNVSNWDGANGTSTFGIYSGPVKSSKYVAVISGVTAGLLSTSSLSGSYLNAGKPYAYSLVLEQGSSDTWDLLFPSYYPGPTVANTNQSLVNTASVLQGTYTLQNSVLANSFTYDCTEFGANNVCVSVGGRNTAVAAVNGLNNTSALLIGAYRPHPNYRIGAYADQNLSVNNQGSTVNLSNNTPMLGLFGAWNERLDGTGAEVKVSAAYGQKNATITRSVVGSGDGASEAGSGSSKLISQGAQAIAKYGFAITDRAIFSPYVGVRYTQNNTGGYTETASSSVTAPLTYSALNTNATTALAGVGISYKVIPLVTTLASIGVESDTNTASGTYSATNSSIGVLNSVNFNANPVKTRPTATVGAYYDMEKNQRLGITGIYRQEPYQAVSTTTVMATYTVGL
jgi:Autotransporter beta-domain